SLTSALCFHEVANSFSLFAARAKQKPFPLNRFHTLLQNTGGGGIPTGTSFNHYLDSVSNSSSLPYILPSSVSSKSFASHSYEKYGVWGYSSQFGTQIVKTLEGTKMNKLLMALAAMGMVFAAQERKPEIPLPEVPKSLQAPAGEKVI